MKPFSYAAPKTYPEAAALLHDHPLALPKAGGTDLLDLLKEGVLETDEIVGLGQVPFEKGNPNSLPAGMTLAMLSDAELRKRFPALAEAAEEAATPQVRNQGTLGGNLCQLPRCAYLRTRHACLRLGDDTCAAAAPGALTRFHGVFPASGCLSAHSSSLAPALIVLDAKLRIQGPKGTRELAIEDLYRSPESGAIGDTVLGYDELITRVDLLPSALASSSTYLEVRERQSFDFALVNLAVAATFTGGKKLVVKEVRLAAGGIAPTPRRLRRAEAALRGKPLTTETLAAAGAAAVAGAQPTPHNGHKLVLLNRLIARGLARLAEQGGDK
ncbi:MAG: FAD binding domain-containing protein [Planctomycetes bacterium]|nr:FAD binding domain-containing protein [Planctomycetota bacterium]